MNRAFKLLYGHFLKEYFFIQTASGHRENSLSIGHIFAFLFVPGIFLAGFSLMKTGPLLDKPPADHVISGLDDRLVFIVFAMVVAALASVLNLHKLLPRRREFDTLNTLPISRLALVSTRVAAYLSFVLLICVDAAIVSCFIYPLSLAPWDSPFGVVVRIFIVHVLTITGCTLFTVALVSGLYALCRYLMPSAIALFNLVAVTVCIAFLFVGPLGLKLLQDWPVLARANPALWFTGFYELRLPRISPDVELQGRKIIFNFAALSHDAVIATVVVLVVGLGVVFVICYQSENDRLTERRRAISLRGRIVALAARLIPRGVPRAAATAYWIALYRVPECRLALALVLGTACGVILNELSTADGSSRWLFVAPFVLTFFLITGLVAVTRMPVNLEARWILQLSPDLGSKQVRRGIISSIAVFALLPLSLLLLGPYSRKLGTFDAASLLAFTGLAALILLEVITWDLSSFPFSFERTTPQQALPFIFVCFCLALIVYGLVLGTAAESLLRRHWLLYTNPTLVAVWFAIRASYNGLSSRDVTFTEIDEDEVQLLRLS